MPTHLDVLPCCNKRVLLDGYNQRNCFMCPMNDGVECGLCVVLQKFPALEMLTGFADTLLASVRSMDVHCIRHCVFDDITDLADQCTPAHNRFAGKRCVRVYHTHTHAHMQIGVHLSFVRRSRFHWLRTPSPVSAYTTRAPMRRVCRDVLYQFHTTATTLLASARWPSIGTCRRHVHRLSLVSTTTQTISVQDEVTHRRLPEDIVCSETDVEIADAN
jgi:hypothetical protein